MKKSIVATLISAILVVPAVMASCGEPAAIAPGAVQTPPQVKAIPDEERLTAMQSSIGMLINDYSARGLAAPEYLFDIIHRTAQAIETLRRLDGQRAGISMLIAQYEAEGTSAPGYVDDAVNQVEQARSEVLRGVGLEQ